MSGGAKAPRSRRGACPGSTAGASASWAIPMALPLDGEGHGWGFGRVECGALANGEDGEDEIHPPFAFTTLPGPALALAAAGHMFLAICIP